MVSKNNFQQNSGRPMHLQQQRSVSMRGVPQYKKPFKPSPPNGTQMMYSTSQLPGEALYMDFNNPTPPMMSNTVQGPQNMQQQMQQLNGNKRKNRNIGGGGGGGGAAKQKNYNNKQQHGNMQQYNKQQSQNGNNGNNNWSSRNRNPQQQDNRYMNGMGGGGGNMQRNNGAYNQQQMMGNGMSPNRAVRHMMPPMGGPPMGSRIGPMQQHPPMGFQPPMPQLRGAPIPPMGGGGPPMVGGGPPMGGGGPPSSHPAHFMRRNGRTGNQVPPQMAPPMMQQRMPPRGMQPVPMGPYNNSGGSINNNNHHNHQNNGKIMKPNPKLIKHTVKGKSTIKTLKNLVNQYPIDKPWVTNEIRIEHDKKIDIENRLKGHKDDDLFAQFKVQRDKFVSMYETAREIYLKPELANVMSKDTKDKQTNIKNAVAKVENNKDAIPNINNNNDNENNSKTDNDKSNSKK